MTNQSDEQQDISTVITQLMSAWNTHDMQAFAQLFTHDASFVNVNGSWLESRAEIEASHRIVHNTIFKDSTAEIRPVKISPIRPDVAAVHATWEIRGDSRQPAPRHYVMTLVLRRPRTEWKILAAQNGSTEDRSSSGFANVRRGDMAPLPAPSTSSDPEIDTEPLHTTISAFDEAWNGRDRAAMAAVFVDVADFVDTNARWLQGRERIANHIIDVEHPGLGNPTRSSGIEKLTILYPELAIALVRWNLERWHSTGVLRQGMGLRVMENESGDLWQILAGEDTLVRASG